MSDGPIFTGWVQTQFAGDIERAQELQREARRMLGLMLETTGVNAREAAGEPTGFFRATRLLADGSRLTAWHNNGHNVIRIDAPPPVRPIPTIEPTEVSPPPSVETSQDRPGHADLEFDVPPPPELPMPTPTPAPRRAEETEEFDELLSACGDYGGSDDVYSQPWVFKDGEGYAYPEVTVAGGSANGLSWDGDTACGSAISFDTIFEDYNFIWTRSGSHGGTTENIGLAMDFGYAGCISGDGRMVGTDDGYYWTRDGGWQQVALNELSVGPALHGTAGIHCIGFDAKVMGGYIGVDNGWGNEIQSPCLWSGNGQGGFSAKVLDAGGFTWESEQEGYALGDEPPHWVGHTFIPTVHNVTNELVAYLPSPLEEFTEFVIESTPGAPVVNYTITHRLGGAVSGVRSDGSVACGFVGQPGVPDYQAAIWENDALRVIGMPGGWVSAVATGISESGPIVVSGLGSTGSASGWWVWSEDTGFVIVNDDNAQGYCISQDGQVSGGYVEGEVGFFGGSPAMADSAASGTTQFEPPPMGSCFAINRVRVERWRDEDGLVTRELSEPPVMEGLLP